MRFFVADAFTSRPFSGNAAGVVLLEGDFPSEGFMRKIAAELKHSETAFVREDGEKRYFARYFTPTEEVDFCGHATIAAFAVLRDECGLAAGGYALETRAGEMRVRVGTEIWLRMAAPAMGERLDVGKSAALYAAFGLTAADAPDGFAPAIVRAGLADIQLPVRSPEGLAGLSPDMAGIAEVSARLDVCGVHAFCLPDAEGIVRCRNFAPLFGIPEEAATGTANMGLTEYLFRAGELRLGATNRFLQGEAMGRPSLVYTRRLEDCVELGGDARVIFACAPRFRGEAL